MPRPSRRSLRQRDDPAVDSEPPLARSASQCVVETVSNVIAHSSESKNAPNPALKRLDVDSPRVLEYYLHSEPNLVDRDLVNLSRGLILTRLGCADPVRARHAALVDEVAILPDPSRSSGSGERVPHSVFDAVA